MSVEIVCDIIIILFEICARLSSVLFKTNLSKLYCIYSTVNIVFQTEIRTTGTSTEVHFNLDGKVD